MRLIDAQYPGGWSEWKARNARVIGRSAWFDDHLYTQGAMNGADIDWHAEQWKQAFSLLFTAPEDYAEHWHTAVGKYLIANGGQGEWYKIGNGCAWFVGDEDSERIGRGNVSETMRYRHPENFPPQLPKCF
jgi:hypothetical protein